MSTRKPITDVKELIILSEIDLEKDSEKEIIYKFGLLMGDWNIIEISILADYIYFILYLIDKKINRKFTPEMEGYLHELSDWDFYNGRGERWSYDEKEFVKRNKRIYGVYQQKDKKRKKGMKVVKKK
ncbi:MAG TPA: hypothetical protein P5059_02355 [Candidatus Dojkabacteria bacterium]|nr:hypothetical protein [Candidatus Dojkabacteria bacterium]